MWGARPEGPPCDLGFTEAISKRMQVPLRLQVPGAGEPEMGAAPKHADLPPSFQMHVPERLCLSEVTDVPARPLFGAQLQRHPCPAGGDDSALDLAMLTAVYGEHPFLSFISPSRSQKRKRLGHHGRTRKERGGPPMEGPELIMEVPAVQRQEWLEPSVAPGSWSQPRAPLPPPTQLPLFPPEGRIYSLQNVLQALRFLGQQLVQLFRRPHLGPCSSREMGLVLPCSLEEFGPTDILAMRKQLMKISGRLQALEGQSVGWRQKELLFYSLLVSACLLNAWLWLRR